MEHKCRKCEAPVTEVDLYCDKCEPQVIASNIESMLGRIKVASYDKDMANARFTIAQGELNPRLN